MKKIFSVLLIAVAIVSAMSLVASARFVTVKLDGEVLEFDVQAEIINDRTMVPLRKIFESMGAVVDWDPETYTAYATKGTRTVKAQINNPEISINSVTKSYDTPPMLKDNRTLVPVRFVAEAFGVLVEWDNDTSTVTLTSPEKRLATSLIEKIPYDYDLSPYIEIKHEDYTGVQYTALDHSATNDEIMNAVVELVNKNAQYVEVDRECKAGDVVVVDFLGKINGVAFEGGAASEVQINLGSGGYIPGFEEGIIGHKKGEPFDIKVTFPENYGVEELNGVEAVFEILIHSVTEIRYPQISDDFIKSATGYDNVGEYMEAIKLQLEESKKASNLTQQKNEVMETVMSRVKIIGLPKTEYEAYYNEYFMQYMSMAEQYGMEFEAFLAYAGTDMAGFVQYAEEYASSNVTMELVFFSIVKGEGILEKLTVADYIEYLDRISVEYQMNHENFENTYGVQVIFMSLIWERALDYVIENGVAVGNTDK